MKTVTQRKKGCYQQKKEAGLVPHHYDRDSRSFNEGAWKHWGCRREADTRKIIWTCPMEDRPDLDRKFLELARELR